MFCYYIHVSEYYYSCIHVYVAFYFCRCLRLTYYFILVCLIDSNDDIQCL